MSAFEDCPTCGQDHPGTDCGAYFKAALSAERQKVAALEAKLAAATKTDCVHASGCEPGCLSCVKTQLFHARKHLAEADSENGALREAVQEAVEYDLDGGPCDHRDSDSGCERCELRRMFYKALASSSGKAALEERERWRKALENIADLEHCVAGEGRAVGQSGEASGCDHCIAEQALRGGQEGGRSDG